MQRTSPDFRSDPTARLAELDQRRPEWRGWLELLEVVASHESSVAVRESPIVRRESRVAGGESPLPLLHRCRIRVDAGGHQALLRRLLSTAAGADFEGAASLREFRPTRDDVVGLVLAAVRQDGDQLAAIADAADVDRGALASVAHLAALPLLQACGRQLRSEIPAYWPQGYCPVCAAWPILAERRGLDRSRRLRCGRCSSEWEVEWLCCIYCREREHRRLGTLEPEEGGERLKVETCASCKGYLKSISTLQGFSPLELLLQDLETIELDLVAMDRGFGRPEERAFDLEVMVG